MTEIYGLQRKYQESEERRRSEMEFLQRNQRFVSRMVAADPRTLEVLARAQKVAALDTTILLLGETGVGKEQFARYIYENSARARQSFIGINCGAIPASLIESELFGYEKGAFTGASKEGKMGVFESADKGTVFLDEVGDLPLEMQVHPPRPAGDAGKKSWRRTLHLGGCAHHRRHQPEPAGHGT